MGKVLVNKQTKDVSQKRYTISDVRNNPDNKIILDRNNYKGTQLLWKNLVTGKFYFAEFAFNGHQVSRLSQGYTRIANLLEGLTAAETLRQTFRKPASKWIKERNK